MNSFIGTFSSTVDNNNRIGLPAKLKKIFEKLDANSKDINIVVSKGQANYLKLYPNCYWDEAIAQRVKQLPQMDARANDVRRHVGETTIYTKLDSHGRLTIPSEYYDHAGIQKAVTIIGTVDSIQLWNPETHKKNQQDIKEADIAAAMSEFGL